MRFGQMVLILLACQALSVPAWAQDPGRHADTAPQETMPTKRPLDSSADDRKSLPDLTLARALDLALSNNPRLQAAADVVQARQAAADQAGVRPNPELALEMENFGGEDELEGFDGAETTLALSQRFELGGKREKRRALAKAEQSLAEIDLRLQQLDQQAGTAKAFIRVLTAQERLTQSVELVRISEQTLAAVSARVEAGKVPPLDTTKARVELAVARTEAAKADRSLTAARRGLVSRWGAREVEFTRAVGDLATIAPLPPEHLLLERLSGNPVFARGDREQEKSRAELDLARSQSLPDLTLSLGVRNFQGSDSNALVAGFEFPLPLFDRNQGGVRESMAMASQARRERMSAEIELRAELLEAWQGLAAAHRQATDLRDEILPGAQTAFEATEYGYREGKFDFLQMLDAQRTLFEVRGHYLDALTTYHLNRIEIERLVGGPLHELLPAANLPHPNLR